MPLSIETLRVRIGLAANDPARDAEINAVSKAAMALLENYCDRKFPFESDQETFTHFDGVTVSLRRYPIWNVSSVTDYLDNPVSRYHVDKERGLVMFDDYRVVRHELKIRYQGGFDLPNNDGHPEFPEDLLMAFYNVFDAIFDTYTGAAGAGALGAGVVKSIASDGSRVEFFDPTSGGAAAVGIDPESGLPVAAAAIIANYRRRWC